MEKIFDDTKTFDEYGKYISIAEMSIDALLYDIQ